MYNLAMTAKVTNLGDDGYKSLLYMIVSILKLIGARAKATTQYM